MNSTVLPSFPFGMNGQGFAATRLTWKAYVDGRKREHGKRHTMRAHNPQPVYDWLNPYSLGTVSEFSLTLTWLIKRMHIYLDSYVDACIHGRLEIASTGYMFNHFRISDRSMTAVLIACICGLFVFAAGTVPHRVYI